MSIISGIDSFGTPIGLNYKNESTFRSQFGGFTTIAYYVTLAFLFYQIVINLYSKSVVRFTSSQIYDIDPPELTIDTNKYMLAVKIDQQDFITRPYFNITLEDKHYQRFQNGSFIKSKVQIDLEPCTLEHFRNLPSNNYDWEDAFKTLSVSDYLCLKKGKKFTLKGKYESSEFKFFKITVQACMNSTYTRSWMPACQTQESIDQKIQDEDTRINFLYSNTILSPEKPSQTKQDFLDGNFFTLQPKKMYSTANIFLSEHSMSTDDSLFLFNMISTENQVLHTFGDYKQSYAVGSFEKFGEFFFARSSISRSMSRSFLKIDEVISYIGGFTQLFVLIVASIVGTFNSFAYQMELANRLYDFDFKPSRRKSSDLEAKSRNSNRSSPKQQQTFTPVASSHQISSFNNNSKHRINKTQTSIFQANNSVLKNESDYFMNNPNISAEEMKKSCGMPADQVSLSFGKNSNVLLPPNESVHHSPIIERLKSQNCKKLPPKHKFSLELTALEEPQIKLNRNHSCNQGYATTTREQINNNNNQSKFTSPAAIIGSSTQTKNPYSKLLSQSYIEREWKKVRDSTQKMRGSFDYLINVMTFGKFRNTTSVQLIKEAQNQIAKDLDICVMLQRLKEVEKLKNLLLSHDQLVLFNFFPKQRISLIDSNADMPTPEKIEKEESLNKSKSKIKKNFLGPILKTNFKTIVLVIKAFHRFKKLLNRTQQSMYVKLYDAYDQVVQDHSHSCQNEFNQRLVNQLGPTMKYIFQEAHKIQYSEKSHKEFDDRNLIYPLPLIQPNSSQTPAFQMRPHKFNLVYPPILKRVNSNLIQEHMPIVSNLNCESVDQSLILQNESAQISVRHSFQEAKLEDVSQLYPLQSSTHTSRKTQSPQQLSEENNRQKVEVEKNGTIRIGPEGGHVKIEKPSYRNEIEIIEVELEEAEN